jgi:hypothetical protein
MSLPGRIAVAALVLALALAASIAIEGEFRAGLLWPVPVVVISFLLSERRRRVGS